MRCTIHHARTARGTTRRTVHGAPTPGGEAGDEKASGFVVAVPGGERPGSVLVVTNRHVVLDDNRRLRGAPAPLRVTFSDGVAADAQLLGISDEIDVALLRVPRPRAAAVPAAPLGDSDALRTAARLQVALGGRSASKCPPWCPWWPLVAAALVGPPRLSEGAQPRPSRGVGRGAVPPVPCHGAAWREGLAALGPQASASGRSPWALRPSSMSC